MAADPIPPTVEWRRGRVRLVDQRALPGRLRFLECATVGAVRDAITSLAVRGAPALGATGAYGVALAARTLGRPRAVEAAATRLRSARPTAVNLAWGVDRALAAYGDGGFEAALAEARRIADADVAANRLLGALGARLLPDAPRVLTHCNAGSLACVGYGTALGVVRAAAEAGMRPSVWVTETRPVLQGARLTAWELGRLAIPHTLVADTMAAALMARGEVDAVVVGADRIAANGDVANKIGTYQLAVLARQHGVPFLVAAPWSTVDLATASGAGIPIEARTAEEVTTVAGRRIAPRGVEVLNLAFDVTPARLVDAIVTERGVAHRPSRRALRRLFGNRR
ncbi:MAG TPA: S-methyl-5-thioribose-1-phosphate isomerase [Acidimicrobiia bacterium]|nr:S-methyl-5-thioribose-1-phosphate isomerase [Acidimicrobiia bacterium]